jgi:hypothetical protein
LTCDEHGITREYRETLNSFQNCVDRFEHGAFFERISSWYLDHTWKNKWHDADIFSETSTSGFEAGGYARLFILRALGERSMPTSMTTKARHMVV